MSEPLIRATANPSDRSRSARGIDAASHGGEVTCQSDRDEMANAVVGDGMVGRSNEISRESCRAQDVDDES